MSMPSGSGKYYWEAVFTRTSTTDGDVVVGIVSTTWNPGEATGSPSVSPGNTSDSWGVSGNNGNKINNGSGSAYGSSFASGDIIMVAYDAVNGSFYVGKNGTWFNSGVPASNTGSAFTGITTEVLPGFGMAFDSGSSIVNVNFGQRPFSYTPPTGFVRLNTFNLPDSTIKKGNTVMDATLYTGTGTTQVLVNQGQFKPDLVWTKSRSNAYNNVLCDSVRGVAKGLFSDLTNAEDTASPTSYVQAFNSNGFSVNIGTNSNANGATYVGWQWQAGQGTNTSNTSGSITSTVSVNATAGFSVVTYTGNSTSGATVGHGLGVTPSMIILKSRSFGDTGWAVKHKNLSSGNNLRLNTTAAQGTLDGYGVIADLNSSTTFTLTSGGSGNTNVNNSGSTYVAYCWSEIAGFSRFGSYTGNGSSDGPFVFTNFRPKYILAKSTGTASWFVLDTARLGYNSANNYLLPNASSAEATYNGVDILSNGFKVRNTDSGYNDSGVTYIYMAFAENPFKNSLAR
jgi:hypothetical protein